MESATPRSMVPGIVWPSVWSKDGVSALRAMVDQLDQTQWWPAERIRRAQFRQIGHLFKHVWDTIPFYRQRLNHAGWEPGVELTDDIWLRIPTLRRQEIQARMMELRSPLLPPGHGRLAESQTSGSTGQPVRFCGTAITRLIWSAMTLRHHLWNGDDFTGRLASIRHGHGAVRPSSLGTNWGAPISTLFETGPAALADCRQDVAVLLDWLVEQNPDYVIALPSTIEAIARLSHERGTKLPHLKGISTYAETVTPEARREVRQAWGVKIRDMYSSQEVGYVATQCPDHEHYHIQSESLFVEVLDDENQPCKPGQIGRVAVTSLLNFAMPFIRYEVGDYAEVGKPCLCGRGLPVLQRVLGRRRNLITTPDGKRYWPVLETKAWAAAAPIRQIQLIQKTPDRFEVRLVMNRPPTDAERTRLSDALATSLGYRFEFDYTHQTDWIRSRTGKFETIVSEVDDAITAKQ